MANFNIVLGQMAILLPKFGKILGNIFDSLLSVLTATYPLTTRFVAFLERKTGSLAAFLDVKNATGELTGFFDRAGDIAADFGAFFGGVFSGLGKMIQVNFGPGSPGDELLQWIRKAGEGFANKDLIGLDKYFDGAVDNFITMAKTLGGAIESIVRAGSNPAVKKFWETLDRGSFAFDKVVNNFVESGPAFGDLLRSMTEVRAVLSDAGPVDAFIKTLSVALDGIARFLKSIEPVLQALGPIFGIISATTLLLSLIGKVVLVFGSFFTIIAKGLGAMAGFTAATVAQDVATKGAVASSRAYSTALLATPLGPIIAITAAITALVIGIQALDAAAADAAVAGITQVLDTSTGSILEASRAADILSKTYKDGFLPTQDIKELVGYITTVQEAWGPGKFFLADGEGTRFAKQLDAIGTSLANVAVHDVAKAQSGFRKLRFEMSELSDKEMFTVINEMDDFRESLISQADQLDINIHATDGTIDMQKLLNFAMGDGEYLLRQNAAALDAVAEAEAIVAAEAKRLFDAQVNLNTEFAKQDIEAAGWRNSVSDAYKNVTDQAEKATLSTEKFNKKFLSETMTNLNNALTESAEFSDTMTELRLRGLGDAGLQIIRDAGPQAKALAEALVNATDEEFTRFGAIADAAALKLSTPFQETYQKLIDLWATGKLGKAAADELLGSLSDATTPEALQSVIDSLADIEFEIGLEVETEAADAAMKAFKNKWGDNIAGAIKQSDRTGKPVLKVANGGYISGPGGPRSDMIPAMLSNGEYVVNARATQKNRSLLERINGVKGYADGGLVTPSMGAGISITVNPSPGMDEKALAMAVSRRLAFEMRKGTI
jgi:hypothetical protein